MLPLDLHVLGLPPAFNLSHDQTLQFKSCVHLSHSEEEDQDVLILRKAKLGSSFAFNRSNCDERSELIESFTCLIHNMKSKP